MNKTKKFIGLFIMILFFVFSIPLQTSATVLPFTDVKTSDWYYESVVFVSNAGLMGGTSPTTFSPNSNMNRADFVTVIGRLSERLGETISSTNSHPFTDVSSNSYYNKYVGWAYQKKIVDGTTATTFTPTKTITREEVAVIIQRFMNYKRKALHDYGKVTFSDESTISSWAIDAVKACGNGKIFFGDPNNAFRPKSTIKRCEIAGVLANLINFQFNK